MVPRVPAGPSDLAKEQVIATISPKIPSPVCWNIIGFKVTGQDARVPSVGFIKAVKAIRPMAFGLSGLLTSAYDPAKEWA